MTFSLNSILVLFVLRRHWGMNHESFGNSSNHHYSWRKEVILISELPHLLNQRDPDNFRVLKLYWDEIKNI